MGLGPFHTVSLAEAREKAEVCRAMRLKGLDPLAERLKEQQAKTTSLLKLVC
jgi:Arm DNA-binding domain